MDSKPNWPNRQLADGYNFVDAASVSGNYVFPCPGYMSLLSVPDGCLQ